MKILVIGTWNKEVAAQYSTQAENLGKELAMRGHTLIASPSSGIQGLVAKAYKENYGYPFIGYYPRKELMEEMGEVPLVTPHVQHNTQEDYPVRNIIQVRSSEAVIALTGGIGTLTELLAAVNDYKLPTAYCSGSSEIVDNFLQSNDTIKRRIRRHKNISYCLDYLEREYSGEVHPWQLHPLHPSRK